MISWRPVEPCGLLDWEWKMISAQPSYGLLRNHSTPGRGLVAYASRVTAEGTSLMESNPLQETRTEWSRVWPVSRCRSVHAQSARGSASHHGTIGSGPPTTSQGRARPACGTKRVYKGA